MPGAEQNVEPLFVFGHRGAAGHAPENTLQAIRLALDFGADGVEIDVRLHDDTIIVLHDERLERTTSGRGSHKALSLADLRRLDAGAGERIPLLDEVVDLLADRCALNVEIKEAGIAREVVAALERRTRVAWRSQILLSAFDPGTTAALAELRGDMRLGVLYKGDPSAAIARAAELEAFSLHLPFADVEPALIDAVHAHGLRAYVYTVNTPTAIDRCHAARVDGVFSDFPDRVIAYNSIPGTSSL